MRLFRLSGFKIALSVGVAMVALYAYDAVKNPPWLEFFRLIEYKAYDWRFQLRGEMQPGNDVVILAIDEKSIEELGRWPWPRKIFAKAYENLAKDGAAVIANDVIFSEPDPNDAAVQAIDNLRESYTTSGLRNPNVLPDNFSEIFSKIINELDGEQEEQARSEVAGVRESLQRAAMDYVERNRSFYNELRKAAVGGNDQALADVVARYPQIILGYFFYMNRTEVEGLSEEDYHRGLEYLDKTQLNVKTFQVKGAAPETVPLGKIRGTIGLRQNVASLADAATYLGYFNAEQDSDGVIRSYLTTLRYEDKLFPSLALSAVSAFFDQVNQQPAGTSRPLVIYEEGVGARSLEIPAWPSIPVDEQGRLLINYYGPQKMLPHYSFVDAVQGSFEPGTFKDKIVVVGSTAIAVYDLRPTPFQRNYPGVEIHATVIDNLLQGNYMQPADGFMQAVEVGIILLLAIVLGIALPRMSAWTGAALTVAAAVGLFAANFYYFEQGFWLNLIYPMITLGFCYAGITVYRYATEERQKKQIKDAFGLYLHPAMVDQVAQNPNQLKLGGERRELTAFFSDIAGFSSFSEKMEPEDLVSFLNEYLTEMTEILQGYDATVDKYIGDAIVAFFGAPLPFDDHAVKACHATLDMQKRLDELRQKWDAQGLPQVHQRIGLNTGQMVVGNMGSSTRFNYTMMGDAVNLAARLESGAKQYGVEKMIGEETERQARHAVETRYLDKLVVKGRTKPVTVFELIAKKGELSETMKKILPIWREGIERYLARDFEGALEKFHAILDIRPDDGPSEVYIERCEQYRRTLPPEGWTGVYVATSK